ncbi:MAG: DUF5329 domain-containing protein [Desulfobacterales bacterium]|jgi:hypothetical protein
MMTSILRKIGLAIVILLVCLLALPAVAGDANLQAEMDHLMQSIQNSNCAFIRNGKTHSSDEAMEHILNKYEHFKDRIQTSEDFIDYCASKSLMSNKPYQIKCPDQDIVESRLWFQEALKRFRNH